VRLEGGICSAAATWTIRGQERLLCAAADRAACRLDRLGLRYGRVRAGGSARRQGIAISGLFPRRQVHKCRVRAGINLWQVAVAGRGAMVVDE
jgi:hypothetical protein